ncbi:MAG: Oligopeptide transport system permease protein OppB [Anaerolineae bacterium]|nr:Oligopeptide transport system permease protein OppB [Anaerolineae bacterium]
MTRYIIRRGIQSFFLIWISTLIAFTIYQAAPGGPIQFLDDDPKSTTADVDRLKLAYGLNRSIPVQYLTWLTGEDWLPKNETWRSGRCLAEPDRCGKGVLRLDFGRSFYFKGQPAIDVITERIPATFTLALASLILSVVGGVPLGVYAAIRRGRLPDHIIRVSTVLVNTVPHWWLGLLLLIILGGYLGLVPLSGMYTVGDGSLLDRLHHLILPATVGAIGGWIGFSRILRFEMLEVLNQDYVRTARAKGLTEKAVVWRHVLRNAIMPFVTGLSGIFLLALSGSVLFETVFSWPGMGRLFITAVNARDFPVMMALFVIGSFLGILGVLMVDILYSIVDPRVRYDITK